MELPMIRSFTLLFLTGCGTVVVDFGDGKSAFDDTGPIVDTADADTDTDADTDADTDTDTDTAVSGALSITPASFDFGLLFVGQTADATFTVENVGDGPLALVVGLAAAEATEWTTTLADEAPGAGSSTSLIVTLSPGSFGSRVATVTVSDTAGSGGVIELVLVANVQEDADGDGIGSLASGGTDCDDTDASTYPGAADTWYDGIDSDCAGNNDYDQDVDGFAVDTDCDDTDPAIYPGAADTWYDGVDSDCAGNDDDDQDADGYGVSVDCDDTSAAVNPGAVEVWYDGVDSDCAGDNDYDQDADGYDNSVDCDDVNAAVYPGAPDAWYDGIDADCAGNNDYDQDADGIDNSTDCDDTNAAIGAPTTEAWNGLDDDCDGTIDDLDVGDVASGVLFGATANYALGASRGMALGGDLDGDGGDDLIALTNVSSAGTAWLVPGDDAVGAYGAIGNYDQAVFTGYTSTYYGTYTLSYIQGPMGDITGDGTDDVLIAGVSSYTGLATFLDGDDASGTISFTSTYDGYFTGDSSADMLRWAVTGDIDGDGVAEVVTGCIYDSYTSSYYSYDYYTGNIGVFSSSNFSGNYDLGDAEDEIHGADDYDYLGTAVAIGDTNGDGYDDIIAGASGSDDGASNAGTVYVFRGNSGLSWSSRADSAASASIYGTTASMGLGGDPIPTPGDLDGDGADDVALAAATTGTAWVFFDMASTTGSVSVTTADAIWSGTASSFATAIASASDLDGDGTDDLVIGASGDDTAASNAGAAFLFYGGGAWTTAMTSTSADVSLYGEAANDGLGAGLAAGGDLDRDGNGDLLIGATGVDTSASNGGAVYVLLGR